MSDTWTCILREIVRRKGRAFSNIFGYILAVMLIVILANVLLFAKTSKGKILNNLGTHFLAYLPANPEIASGAAEPKTPLDPSSEAFFADPSRTRLFPLSLAEEIAKLPTVLGASPFLLYRFKDPRTGFLFSVGGFDPGKMESVAGNSLQESDIIKGSFLRPGDRGMALVEEGYAAAWGLKVGSLVEIAGIIYPVVGVVAPGIRPAKADVYISYQDALRTISRRLTTPLASDANVLVVEVSSSKVQDQAIADVQKLMPGCIIDTYACYKPASQVMGMSESAVFLLIIILMIGVMLVSMKSQLAAFVERRHDIGILKAIGWTGERVFMQIIGESLVQWMIGGFFGTLFGAILISTLPGRFLAGIPLHFDPNLTPIIFGLGLLLSLVGGLFSGFIPAYYASRESPADVLRRI